MNSKNSQPFFAHIRRYAMKFFQPIQKFILDHRADGFALTLLVILFIVFHWTLLTGRQTIPYDSKDQYFPYLSFVVHSLRSGDLPLWNPSLFSGYPAFADPLYQVFSPFVLGLALLAGRFSMHVLDFIEILHILVGALGVYWFARSLKMSWKAALLAAVVFLAGGPLAARLQHFNQIITTAYFPYVFLLLRRGLLRQNLAAMALAALLGGVLVISGYQLGLLMFLCFGAYFGFYLLNQRPTGARLRWSLLAMLMFGALAVGVSLVQAIPAFEFSHVANRADYSYAAAAESSMSPAISLMLFFPQLFRDAQGNYPQIGDITEAYLYLGIIGLLLGITALVHWRKLSGEVRLLGGLALAAALYAFGRYTPFYPILFHLVPGISLFKRTSEALFIFHTLLALFVGAGLDAWLTLKSPRELVKSLAGVMLLSALGLGGLWVWAERVTPHLPPLTTETLLPALVWLAVFLALTLTAHRVLKGKTSGGMAVLLILLTFADLNSTNARLPFARIDRSYEWYLLFNRPDAEQYLQEQMQANADPFRIWMVGGGLFPNAPAEWSIPSTGGYSPIQFAPYAAYLSSIPSLDSPMTDLLNVRYIIAPVRLEDAEAGLNMDHFTTIQDGKLHLYKNSSYLPRAFLVSEAAVEPDPALVLRQMQNPAFDPRQRIYLAQPPKEMDRRASDDSLIHLPPLRQTEIRRIASGNTSMTYQTITDQDAFFFTSEVDYPGWRATIDGKPVEILRADTLFRAVYLPAGSHSVRFTFRPTSLLLGGAISAASLLAALAVSLNALVHPTRKLKQPAPE